jgi:hypothetical protein
MTTKEHVESFLYYNKKKLRKENYNLIKILNENNFISGITHEFTPSRVPFCNQISIELFGKNSKGELCIYF